MEPETPPGWAKLQAADLAAAAGRAALSDAAAACIATATGTAEAVQTLIAAGRLAEAARLLAHALPLREAVWWACMCARHTAPARLPDADAAARDHAEEWVRHQADAARRAAMAEAQRGGCASAEAWAAVAAFWSGDSISPADRPAVPPPAGLAGTAVSGSVTLAAMRDAPDRRDARLRRFLESASDIAAGGAGRLPWEDA